MPESISFNKDYTTQDLALLTKRKNRTSCLSVLQKIVTFSLNTEIA